MNENFTTNVEVEVNYNSVKPAGYEYESRSFFTDVSWDFTLYANAQGISSMSISAKDQELSITIELLKDGEEDPQEVTIKVKIKNIEIEDQREERSFSSSITPHTLDIEITEIRKINESNFEAIADASLVF